MLILHTRALITLTCACFPLQVLVLDLNNLSHDGTRTLADAFRTGACAALQELHIGSVRLTAESFDVLGTVLLPEDGWANGA